MNEACPYCGTGSKVHPVGKRGCREYQRWLDTKELYDADRDTRLGLIPLLNSMQIEQLQQLQKPVWDGNVISKSVRDELWSKGLIDRWNGWQIVTIYGLAVLETLGLIKEPC